MASSRNGHLKDMPGLGGNRLKASQDEADWELFIVCVLYLVREGEGVRE